VYTLLLAPMSKPREIAAAFSQSNPAAGPSVSMLSSMTTTGKALALRRVTGVPRFREIALCCMGAG
jgi:hypothetical protein